MAGIDRQHRDLMLLDLMLRGDTRCGRQSVRC